MVMALNKVLTDINVLGLDDIIAEMPPALRSIQQRFPEKPLDLHVRFRPLEKDFLIEVD